MAKMMNITKRVKRILETYEDARNRDDVLVYRVLQEIGIEKGISVETMMVSEFLLGRKYYGLPETKSIERAGRKVKELYPHLRGCDNVEIFKEQKEQEYKEYAREVRYVGE